MKKAKLKAQTAELKGQHERIADALSQLHMWCKSNLKPITAPDYTHLDLDFLDLKPISKTESALLSLA